MRDKKCIQNFVRKIKRAKKILEGISIDGEIILKFIIKKWEVTAYLRYPSIFWEMLRNQEKPESG
jgi:hypothetical protein